MTVSLLNRLRKMTTETDAAGLSGTSTRRSGERSVAGVREDVLLHLRQICATRFGSAPAAPSLGLPDLTDIFHGGADAPSFIARSLQRAIGLYETRLVNVQVFHVPGDANDPVLRFEIRGQLSVDGGRTAVQFETRIDPSRRVMIR